MTQIKKTMWIKRHSIATFFLLLFGLPIFYLFTLASLNYAGVCVDEKRWVSDEEIIRNMILDYLIDNSVWRSEAYLRIKDNPEKNKTFREEIYIDYLKNHPNCCMVDRHRKKIHYGENTFLTPSIFQRIFGVNYGMVFAMNIQEAKPDNPESSNTYFYLHNCGALTGDPDWMY
jgi:hypothetical protein